MKSLYRSEELVLERAEKVLVSEPENIIEEYQVLCDEYKKLLRQTKTLIRVADLMQSDLKMLSEELGKVSRIDELTELYNRRYFRKLFLQEWKLAVKEQKTLSALMIDIDYFKKYNDTYGHLEGDQCLKAISKVFQDTIRNPEDHVARFGGEEFVILLPGCKAEAAACVGKKLIENVDALSGCKDSVLYGKNVTISVGLASVIPDKKSHMHDFLDQADQALYESKAEGRHCLRVYDSFEN